MTERQRLREQLASLAYSDPLTGLANRALFADRLHVVVRAARRHTHVFAVLMVDLDGFKTINDTHGHECGDLVLQLVGQRFQRCIRAGDTLARIGGDEFAVLLPQLADQQTASLVARRLIAALQGPFDVNATPITISASIGIAIWPKHTESIEGLLLAADTALYRAKRAGKCRFQWATSSSSSDVRSLPPLTWSAAHAVGIREIDDQHEHLAELIDRLSAALRESSDESTVMAKLDQLIQFATHHFATEERLMELHQVGDQAVHREEHRRLLRDICNLNVAGELASVSLILRYLQEWLLRHVDGPDRQLANALLERGCR